MKRLIGLAALFLSGMLVFCSRDDFYAIGRMHVYNIQHHNDSLFFSTSDSGIFRFSPDAPGKIFRVARSGALPIRSIVFSREGKLYAASYNSGVHYVSGDTLLPVAGFPQQAWSIKCGPDGELWLAGLHGIFRQQSNGMVMFNRMGEVHDIAFRGKELAVAHRNGISIFNRPTGALMREFCKGIVCWTMTLHGSLLIGGGLNECVIIDKDSCATVRFGPKGNIVWSTALDNAGTLYLGTQKGLYRSDRGTGTAHCVGYKGICIKSLLVGNKGRLWVGRFAGPQKMSFFGTGR